MKKEKLSNIIDNINTKYVDEATLYTGKSKKIHFSVMKWGTVAACLSLALVAAFTVPKLGQSRSDNKDYSEQGTEENAYAGGKETAAEVNGSETLPGGAYIGNDIAYEPSYEPTSENVTVSSTTPDYPAMIMVDGKLYKEAGVAFMSVEDIEPDGKIVSTCDGVPTENDQSNFGRDYYYQIGKNNTINVRFDDSWRVFALVDSSDTHEEPSEEGQTAAYEPSAATPPMSPANEPERNTASFPGHIENAVIPTSD